MLLSQLAIASAIFVASYAQVQWDPARWITQLETQSPQFTNFPVTRVVWPGSYKAGAVFTTNSPDATGSPSASVLSNLTAVVNDPLNPITTATRFRWAQRQGVTPIRQVDTYGSRYLQFNIYNSGSGSYFAHNGLQGEDITTATAASLNNFLNTQAREVLLLDINYATAGDASQASTIWGPLFAQFFPNTMSLDNVTIASMLNQNRRVLAFSNFPATNHYLASNAFSQNSQNNPSEFDFLNILQVAPTVLKYQVNTRSASQLIKSHFVAGFVRGQMTAEADLYFDFATYARGVSSVIASTVIAYPKVTWNVLLSDYVDENDVWEVALGLNIDLASCRDNNYPTCITSAAVASSWQSSNLTASCDNSTTNLQTDCRRSCGLCPYTNFGGSTCAVAGDCQTGTCYLRDGGNSLAERYQNPSFCLAFRPRAFCNLTLTEAEACNETDTYFKIQTTLTCGRCVVNYQCSTGYCNLRLGVCQRVPGSFNITVTRPVIPPAPAYDQVVSTVAVQFRADIAPLRPGDPNADYPTSGAGLSGPPSDLNSFSSQQPYLASIFGFLLIPIITGIVLYVIYFFCYYPWCCCDKCAKSCCCDWPCCGPRGTPVWFWVPCAFLFAVLVVILWACLDAQIANGLLTTHLTDPQTGLPAEITDVINRVDAQVAGLVPEAANVVNLINGTFQVIRDTITLAQETIGNIANVSDALDSLARNFSDSNSTAISVNVYDPANQTSINQVVPCVPCDEIGAQIGAVNSTLQTIVFQAANQLSAQINQTSVLTDAESTITGGLNSFKGVVDGLTSSLRSANSSFQPQIEAFVAGEQQRANGFTIFFVVPLVMYVLPPVLGLVLKNKICFKLSWFCAMYLGVLFLIISGIFSFFVVLWADFCVRLDAFESDPFNSQVARQFNLAAPVSAPTAAPTATTGGFTPGAPNIGAVSPVVIVNACFTGENLIQALNLDQSLNWDGLRTNIKNSLEEIDIVGAFTSQADAVLQLRDSALNFPNTSDAFRVPGDQAIATLTSVPNCTCPGGATFDRNTLLNNCSTGGAAGLYVTLQSVFPTGPVCAEAYRAAYMAVQGETFVTSQAEQKVAAFERSVNRIFEAYDILYIFALRLEGKLREFACSLDPIFGAFDNIIATYGNCGIIGVVYGKFKRIACVNLFEDMYRITRALIVVGYMSILVVIFGMMMDDRVDESRDEELGVVEGAILVGSSGRESYDQGMEMPGRDRRSVMDEPGAVGGVTGAEGGYGGYANEGPVTGSYGQYGQYGQQATGESVRYV